MEGGVEKKPVKSSKLILIEGGDSLIILYIPINTPTRYIIVVLFCLFNSIIRSCNQNILHSWITNEILDLNNNNVVPNLYCLKENEGRVNSPQIDVLALYASEGYFSTGYLLQNYRVVATLH